MAARISSGTWIVVLLVTFGILGVAGSWWQYHKENPTSLSAQLIPMEGGGWSVEGTFSPKQSPQIVPGTAGVVTSPDFPEWKMSGVIQTAAADGSFTLRITTGPPSGSGRQPVPCVVTIDAATRPVSP